MKALNKDAWISCSNAAKTGTSSCIILMLACIHESLFIYQEKYLQRIWLCWLISLLHLSQSLQCLTFCHSFFLLSFISSPHLFCTLPLSVWQTVFVIGCLLCWADSCISLRLLSCQSSEMHITAGRRNLNTNITADIINHIAFTRQT